MIDKTADRIATGIKRRVPEHPSSIEVLRFALAILINTVLIIGITLLISVFTGNVSQAVITLISFALLRQVTGGLHLNSGMACVLFTTSLFTFISFININNEIDFILNFISLIIVLIFAPSGIEKQSRIKKKYYPLLKAIGCILIISSLLISDSTLTITFLVQSLTLINLKGGDKNEKDD